MHNVGEWESEQTDRQTTPFLYSQTIKGSKIQNTKCFTALSRWINHLDIFQRLTGRNVSASFDYSMARDWQVNDMAHHPQAFVITCFFLFFLFACPWFIIMV